MKILIIGNSAAGISAAQRIRERDKEAHIAMISDEPFLAYERRKILDYLEGKVKERDLYVRAQDFYKNNSLELFLDREVVGLNVSKKKVLLKDKESLEFDYLVIATGSRVRLPSLKGIQKEGVVAFNGLKEAKFLIENLPIAHTVAIVGSGTTAVHLARIVAAKKIEVKLFGVLQDTIEGVEVVSDNPVTEILGESEVKAVRLTTNKVVGVSLVIYPEPKLPCVDFLRETEIKLGRGVFVDGQLRTNVPFIFAAGDCAESEEQPKDYGWDNALKDGEKAGGSISADACP